MASDHGTLLYFLGALNSIMILLLGWIKFDQRGIKKDMQTAVEAIWKRLNSHGHDIECTVS